VRQGPAAEAAAKQEATKAHQQAQEAQRAAGPASNATRGRAQLVNLGMSNPMKNGDPANAGASKLYESGERYKPLYEPT